jgi:hypothetical protein
VATTNDVMNLQMQLSSSRLKSDFYAPFQTTLFIYLPIPGLHALQTEALMAAMKVPKHENLHPAPCHPALMKVLTYRQLYEMEI